ncbi:hypothetical protein X945_6015 [Burkholderia pseudomallei ABCPW 107]|nr:hypothetical protein X945_6015 [Burkholderia pseudomallei ABCPW 107]
MSHWFAYVSRLSPSGTDSARPLQYSRAINAANDNPKCPLLSRCHQPDEHRALAPSTSTDGTSSHLDHIHSPKLNCCLSAEYAPHTH